VQFSEDVPNYRRLQRAVEHVNTFWMPINKSVLSLVSRAAAQSNFTDVKKYLRLDPSLYLYVCRQQAKNGIEIFNSPRYERVAEYLPVDVKEVSPHQYESATDLHFYKKHEISVSLAAILSLSDSFEVDDQQVYLTALFRSLGMNLILWNYSDLYLESLEEQRPTLSIEKILTNKLGFSPSSLALKVIQEWGVSDEITCAIEYPKINGKINELCRIGESFAKAATPEIYPQAKNEWRIVKNQIHARLGENGLKLIQQKYEEFVNLIPNFKVKELNFNDEFFSSVRKFNYNPPKFIEELKYEPRSAIIEHYNSLGKIKIEIALKNLFKDIVPKFSFKGLSVYTLDFGTQKLIKQCQIGHLFYHAPYIYIDELSSIGPIESIFSLSKEISTSSIEIGDEKRTQIFQPIITTTGISGILYIEVDLYLHDNQFKHIKVEAKAIQQCLMDTLVI
jgi:hypothetical protein